MPTGVAEVVVLPIGQSTRLKKVNHASTFNDGGQKPQSGLVYFIRLREYTELNLRFSVYRIERASISTMKHSSLYQSLAKAFQIPVQPRTTARLVRPNLTRPSLQSQLPSSLTLSFSTTSQTLARAKNQPKGDRRICTFPSAPSLSELYSLN